MVSRNQSGWSKKQHFDTSISYGRPFLLAGPSTFSLTTVYFDQCPFKLAQNTFQIDYRPSNFKKIVQFKDRPLSSLSTVHFRPHSNNSILNPFLSKISRSATWHILSTNIQFIILTIVICIYKLFSVNCFCSTQDHIC